MRWQSSVAKMTPPPAAPLATSSRTCSVVVESYAGGSWQHQRKLEVGLFGRADGKPSHESEICVGMDHHPELANVEIECLVLVQDVNEGMGDSLEHDRHASRGGRETLLRKCSISRRVAATP